MGLDENVLCIKRDTLHKVIDHPGFWPAKQRFGAQCPLEKFINAGISCIPRAEAESRYDIVQAVVYGVPTPMHDHVQLFVQSSVTENRLCGNVYLGAAGHVSDDDVTLDKGRIQSETFDRAMQREIFEELWVSHRAGLIVGDWSNITISYRGMVYSDHTDVSSQHLLMVYEIYDSVIGTREPGHDMMIVRRGELEHLAAQELYKFDLSERMVGFLTGILEKP